ncbi:hypothetical protein RYX36_008936, partial [Vicia faba]
MHGRLNRFHLFSGRQKCHIHYYINDDNNKYGITVGYTSVDDVVPSNFGINYDRKHKQVATATSLVASHCLEISEYMGVEHEQITTAVDSSINAKTNGDIMTLTAGATTALRGAETLKARLKRGIGATTIPLIEDKCGEAKKASILTALDFVFQGAVLLKRTRKCNCLKNKYLYSLTNHVFSYITVTDLRRLLVRSFATCFSSSGDALMSFSTISKALSTYNQAISKSFTVFIIISVLLTELKILNTNVGRLALSFAMFTDVVSFPM